MKKNALEAKLTLHRETLRTLDRPSLEAVVGGVTQTFSSCAIPQTSHCTLTRH
ncbi:MAG TPA: class I lanthipeptide [Thermoanaerobaculia bacterium]|jgi:hypothetical protein|nr:class I lanthipeptide [Thermoanaerobaculia bacterium]